MSNALRVHSIRRAVDQVDAHPRGRTRRNIRATLRITGAAKNTITEFLVEIGAARSEYHGRILRNEYGRRV